MHENDDVSLSYMKEISFSPDILQSGALGSLVGCQKGTVSAFPTNMSFLHPQSSHVSILEQPGSMKLTCYLEAT